MQSKIKIDKWAYPQFKDWVWMSYYDKHVTNIDEFIARNSSSDFFIGTDSQTKNKQCIITTALIAYKWGFGGCSIIHSQNVPFFSALRQKLLAEAMRSLETAWYVNPKIPTTTEMIIHLDANSDLTWESNKYHDELVGMIVSQGFKCRSKPNAWAASKVADRKCR